MRNFYSVLQKRKLSEVISLYEIVVLLGCNKWPFSQCCYQEGIGHAEHQYVECHLTAPRNQTSSLPPSQKNRSPLIFLQNQNGLHEIISWTWSHLTCHGHKDKAGKGGGGSDNVFLPVWGQDIPIHKMQVGQKRINAHHVSKVDTGWGLLNFQYLRLCFCIMSLNLLSEAFSHLVLT